MEKIAVRFPFEFCALRYLLQWQSRESSMYEQLRVQTPDLKHLRKALRYFQVSRNFKGLKNDDKAEVVRQQLLDVRSRQNLSCEEQVDELARSFKESGFQYNLSAASKMLWLSSRKPIIYDSRALSALKAEFDHRGDKQDYEAYCSSWRAAYKNNEMAIQRAVEELPKARAFLPGATPPDAQLLSLVRKRWFRERVFDIYLWELGGDG